MLPAQLQSLRSGTLRRDGRSFSARMIDAALIMTASLLVMPPLFAVLYEGVASVSVDEALLRATLTSAAIACLSAALALGLAWGLSVAQVRQPRWRGSLSAIGLGGYLVPPAVLATGWFLAFRNIYGGPVLSIVLIASMNALMALPFLIALLPAAVQQSFIQHDRLCAALSVSGFNRLRLIDIPSTRSALAQCGLMAFVLSLGDLTATTLLGSQGLLTLPSLVQQQMGHYQSSVAGGTAFVLAMLCLGLTFAAQRASRWT